MGNRGCLHNEQGRIARPYQGKRWIICQLQFKGRRRTLMAPGRYTELFFLDEATALAAGHRPCAECSRPRFKEFLAAWVRANPELANEASLSVDELDAVLHKERIAGKQKVVYPERLANLPRGSLVVMEDSKQPYLVLEDTLLAWQPEGYGERMARPDKLVVQVLTPRSVVRTLAHGYQAGIHSSLRESGS
jgi:hypothetical protein